MIYCWVRDGKPDNNSIQNVKYKKDIMNNNEEKLKKKILKKDQVNKKI